MKITQTSSVFKEKYKEYEITFSPSFDAYEDFFLYMSKAIKIICRKVGYINIFRFIQLKIQVEHRRFSEISEEDEVGYFYVIEKMTQNTNLIELLEIYREGLVSRLNSDSTEGSGWMFHCIKKLFIAVACTEKTFKKYGSFRKIFPYPVNVPGGKKVVNINTTHDCVQLSMIAHFLILDNIQKNNKAKSKYFYMKYFDKYFKFPNVNATYTTLDNFKQIENTTHTNIIVYNLNVINTERYTIEVLWKGSNNNIEYKRHIHLLTLNTNHHVMLITDVRNFLFSIKYKNQAKDNNKTMCRYCISYIPSTHISSHENLCCNFKSHSIVSAPNPGSVFNFKQLNAINLLPFTAYYDTETLSIPSSDSNSREIINFQLLAFMYVIVNKNGVVLKHKISVLDKHSDSQKMSRELLQNISNDFTELMEDRSKEWNSTPYLTDLDLVKFDSSVSCELCKKKFTNSDRKVRHHDWNKEVVIRDGIVEVGNFVAALCTKCNFVITEKKSYLPVIAHNGGKFDSKFVIDGYSPDFFRNISILPKTSENYLSIKMKAKNSQYGLIFMDSMNFLSSSLDKLSKELKDSAHEFKILTSFLRDAGYNTKTIENVKQKGVFPYQYLSSIDKLTEPSLPPIDSFYSHLTEKSISQEEYSFAHQVFSDASCSTLYDYLKLYLISDVLLIAEVFENLRNNLFNAHGLDIAQFVTMPAYAMQTALFTSGVELGLISDMEIHSLIETNIRGGFAGVNVGKQTFNNPSLKSYNENDEYTSGAFIDYNSLYAHVLSQKLPVSDAYELNQTELKIFDINGIDIDGPYAYILLINYEIPDSVKLKTDDLPLSLHHYCPNKEEVSPFTNKIIEACNGKLSKVPKLIASHLPQENYLISLPLLKHHVKMGLQVTKISRVFRFKQEACFEKYIQKNIEMRKNATSKFTGNMFKLLNNAIYGKCLYQARKHSSRIRLISSPAQFEKYISNLLLKECYPISEDKMIMNFHEPKVKLVYPLYIGFWVLSLAKLKMYSFYYDVLKEKYEDNVSLLYTDTDSFLISFRNVNFFDEISKLPLKQYIDTSNFDKDHPLYSEELKSKLGFLKNEVGSRAIREMIALQPKCYSVLIEDDENPKSTAKGVCLAKQRLLSHNKYNAVHSQTKVIEKIKTFNIRKHKNKLFITKQIKTALTKIDNKRYWLDSVKSYGFGHPYIPSKINYNMEPSTSSQSKNVEIITISDDDDDDMISNDDDESCKIPHSTQLVAPQLFLNFKRIKAGVVHYNLNTHSK